MADRRTRVLTIALAAGVAVAFADSSIVVLALPDLYGEFDTTLVGVSWVITSYNLVVAVAALCLVPFARRLRPRPTGIVGIGLFAAGSAGCAAAWSLDVLIGFRCLQGLGGALLLAASLRGLAAFAGTPARGAAVWTLAGTIGAAAGPGARRRADAALRLARDLRRAGAAGARRARRDGGRSRAQPAAGAPRTPRRDRTRSRPTPDWGSSSARSSARSSCPCCS